MVKVWTSGETGNKVRVVVVKEYESFGDKMFLVHKESATSSKYVVGVKQKDCVDA